MIEISPEEYWLTECTYNEAILYCTMLEIDGKKDYRIMKDFNEYIMELPRKLRKDPWFFDDEFRNISELFPCIPVRDCYD